MVFLAGEPGIGKTRLSARAAEEVDAGGGIVLTGGATKRTPFRISPSSRLCDTGSLTVRASTSTGTSRSSLTRAAAAHAGKAPRTGLLRYPGYEERWATEREALDAKRIRLLYVAATRARPPHRPVREGSRTPGHFLRRLEPLLPEEGRHEVEDEGAWLLDAGELELPPREEKAATDPDNAEIDAALEQRSTWQEDSGGAG